MKLLSVIFSSLLILCLPQTANNSWIQTTKSRISRCTGSACSSMKQGDSTKTCQYERQERLRLVQLTKTEQYVPECIDAGRYFAPKQCHPGTKACWCVMPSGKPIAGSTVYNGNANCPKYGRGSIMSRRSSATTAKRKKRRKCDSADRAKFNSEVVKKFRSEFNRFRTLTSLHSDLDSNDDAVVLGWKFDHLDKDTNGVLSKNETENLKRLVKQQIQPRPCANSFIPFCGQNDKQITKMEWLNCLRSSAATIPGLPFATFKSLVDSSSRGPQYVQQLQTVSSSTRLPIVHPRESRKELVAEFSNCWTDRQYALSTQQLDSEKSTIIPECTPDGKYRRTQCANGRLYCWCVNDTTGLEIMNTVSVNSVPNCDKLKNECFGKRKEEFLKHLVEMYSTMVQSLDRLHRLSSSNQTQDADGTLQTHHVVKLSFERLDYNSNGFLDKEEWATFKNETRGLPKVRGCGKKFLRQCDTNKDSKVSSMEWMRCLQLAGPQTPQSSSRRNSQRSSGGRRVGKNPFTKILQR